MKEFIRFQTGVVYTPYIMIPKYILKEKIPQTAKIVYAYMLSRATGSAKKPKYQDEKGTFIRVSVSELSMELGRGRSVINDAINALLEAGFIEKKRVGLNQSNKYYVMVPLDNQKTKDLDE